MGRPEILQVCRIAGRGQRRRMRIAAFAFVLACLASGSAQAQSGLDRRPSNTRCQAAPVSASGQVVAVPAFPSRTFAGPTQIRQHPLAPSLWYVAERRGLIWTFSDGSAEAAGVALDIRGHMAQTATDRSDSEQWGVMSFAFHPSFPAEPYLYLAYNRKPAGNAPVRSYVSRFTVNPDGRTFNAASEWVLLQADQTRPWHHFGQLQFGPDGRLYLGSGDGGESGRAQDPNSRHGKILRIDVDGMTVAEHARGLRNPWRFAFDGADLWVGDVGQQTWEEIDLVGAGGNHGWPIYEGRQCMQGSCGTPGLIPPVHVFDHSVGTAVIGGYVYRGSDIPALHGTYVFGTVSGPTVLGLRPPDFAGRIQIARLPRGNPTGFYADLRGELYVIDTISDGIWKLVPGSAPTAAAELAAARLSDSGCVDPAEPRRLTEGVIRYMINQPLWSDGADKDRGLALPNGSTISVRPDGDFDLPAGTVLVKTFSFDGQPVETRLFMNHPGGGWRGYSYEWSGGDADLLQGGKAKAITLGGGRKLTWVFPSREQCLQCHTAAAGGSLGLEIAQINTDKFYAPTGRTANQLETWKHIGLFATALPPASELPALATRTAGTVAARARAYLHANCSFCHRPNGSAQANMDLRFYASMQEMKACYQAPLTTDLGIPGMHLLTPGDPDRSMISVRMRRRDELRMPPLATRLVDEPMAAVIDAWINGPDVCNP